MFGCERISRPGLLAAVIVALAVMVAFRSWEWGGDAVHQLIERPLTETLRLSW